MGTRMKPVDFARIKDFKLGDLVYLESKFTGDEIDISIDNCNHIILYNFKQFSGHYYYMIQSFNVKTNKKIKFSIGEHDYCKLEKLKFYLIG